jgi:phospholipid-binding lipoprotein MlaA
MSSDVHKALFRVVLVGCAAFLLGRGATASAEEVDFLSDDFYEDELVSTDDLDPIEPFNRIIFQFNDFTYTWVFEPVAMRYSQVLPADIRGCVSSFFNNLEEPIRAINCLLQARWADAGLVTERFFINSICGVFGLADAADEVFEVKPVSATFGETLATWGVGDGFYLVVPFYGSSTLRDFTGTIIDSYGEPYYLWLSEDYLAMAGVYTVKETNKISLHLGEYEQVKQLSFDPYIALRNGYFQYRKKLRDHGQSRRFSD